LTTFLWDITYLCWNLTTIGRAHIGAGQLNPCSGEAVRLALKKMGRETSARQAQARALGWKEIKEFIGGAGKGLRADRERALLCVAYETLARRSELVALEVRDIDFHPGGTGLAMIRRGKTDAEGQGRVAYLSPQSDAMGQQLSGKPVQVRMEADEESGRRITVDPHRPGCAQNS
jgi:integrase